jgi:hypothetical protein
MPCPPNPYLARELHMRNVFAYGSRRRGTNEVAARGWPGASRRRHPSQYFSTLATSLRHHHCRVTSGTGKMTKRSKSRASPGKRKISISGRGVAGPMRFCRSRARASRSLQRPLSLVRVRRASPSIPTARPPITALRPATSPRCGRQGRRQRFAGARGAE